VSPLPRTTAGAAGALALVAALMWWSGSAGDAPAPTAADPAARPAAPASQRAAPASARAAAETVALRHGVRLVFGPGVQADRQAVAATLHDAASPEAALRALLPGYELLFHYAPSRDGPRLETVWVFDDPADVPRQIAAAREAADVAEALPRDADAATLRRIVDDGDSETVRIAALEAWLQDPHTPPADADRVLAELAQSPHPLLAEQARALLDARSAAPPADEVAAGDDTSPR
jgi:hypothetical protein